MNELDRSSKQQQQRGTWVHTAPRKWCRHKSATHNSSVHFIGDSWAARHQPQQKRNGERTRMGSWTFSHLQGWLLLVWQQFSPHSQWHALHQQQLGFRTWYIRQQKGWWGVRWDWYRRHPPDRKVTDKRIAVFVGSKAEIFRYLACLHVRV